MTPALPDAERSALYRLLGRLLLAEPEVAHVARLREWPPFGEVLAGPDADPLPALRAEYARLFLMNVYPYESVFVDRSVMLGAEPSAAVEAVYAAVGIEIAGVPRPGAPDHLGAELWCLARLVETAPAAEQRRFLEAHPGRFVAPFADAAARGARHPFYRLLARVTAEVILADAGRLVAGALPVVGEPVVGEPVAPADLAAADLPTVAAHIATPVLAGLLLTREALFRLAARLALPLPLLERRRMVEVLFEAAARFGQLAALLEGLEAEARTATACYTALGADHPSAGHLVAPWAARAGATADGLALMRREALAAVGP